MTGDRNLARIQGVLQYHVADPAAFVVSAESVEPALSVLVQASLAESIARRPIDLVLGDRVAIARGRTKRRSKGETTPPGSHRERIQYRVGSAAGRSPGRLRRRSGGEEPARRPYRRGEGRVRLANRSRPGRSGHADRSRQGLGGPAPSSPEPRPNDLRRSSTQRDPEEPSPFAEFALTPFKGCFPRSNANSCLPEKNRSISASFPATPGDRESNKYVKEPAVDRPNPRGIPL